LFERERRCPARKISQERVGETLYQESFEAISHGVKDVDFVANQVIVRDGKGFKDRVTVLPESMGNFQPSTFNAQLLTCHE